MRPLIKFHGVTTVLAILLAATNTGKSQNRVNSPAPALMLYAAGSLRAPMEEIADDFQKREGIRVESTFGPSGLLRERIEHGERPDIFASADLASPQKLVDRGLGSPVRVFTANEICAVARPTLPVEASTLLDVMLDPNVKLATGTPITDPLGDYTESVFDKADVLHSGAKKILDDKAVHLIGGRDGPKIPAGRDATSYFLLEGKQADIMLTYCSGARASLQVEPSLQVLHLPANLSVNAKFGYTILTGSKSGAAEFGRFLESETAQAVFQKHGFLKR